MVCCAVNQYKGMPVLFFSEILNRVQGVRTNENEISPEISFTWDQFGTEVDHKWNENFKLIKVWLIWGFYVNSSLTSQLIL